MPETSASPAAPSTRISSEQARKAVLTLRFLAADAVERANSGHPGMPMGMADAAFVLWTRFLRFNPRDPDWLDRDRFVLSAGHGSMLLYALLHLSGYELSMEEIKRFRQWDSMTPGHPEVGHTPGVETTTGPLGQGFANAVGMALAAELAAARFNSHERKLITHRIYGIAGDGDLMEGVASEAASLAGHLGLGRLVILYDDNKITIDGSTDLSFSEDVGARFEAYGWHVLRVDGHDHEAIAQGVAAGRDEQQRPSLIVCRTHIGMGAPTKQDSSSSHGSPLGPEELRGAKQKAGWPLEGELHVPEDVRGLFRDRVAALRPEYDAWHRSLDGWEQNDAEGYAAFNRYTRREIPADLESALLEAVPKKAQATRKHSAAALNAASARVPSLFGGSADLAGSCGSKIAGAGDIQKGDFEGRNLHFGIREHAMGAMMNGMALHGTTIPYGSTFLVFSDYMRPSVRLAALMKQRAIYIFTHDSVFLGEDGPTHQPIEHLAALRLIPNLDLVRPADGAECAAAWAAALQRADGPTALVFTRQTVPEIDRDNPAGGEAFSADFKRGGYIVSAAEGGDPEIVLAGTGSELHVACDAARILREQGRRVQVSSFPCVEWFLAQDAAYRESVMPTQGPARRVIVEAGRPDSWYRIAGADAEIVGLERFGASAPAGIIAEKLGFTGAQVAARLGAPADG